MLLTLYGGFGVVYMIKLFKFVTFDLCTEVRAAATLQVPVVYFRDVLATSSYSRILVLSLEAF